MGVRDHAGRRPPPAVAAERGQQGVLARQQAADWGPAAQEPRGRGVCRRAEVSRGLETAHWEGCCTLEFPGGWGGPQTGSVSVQNAPWTGPSCCRVRVPPGLGEAALWPVRGPPVSWQLCGPLAADARLGAPNREWQAQQSAAGGVPAPASGSRAETSDDAGEGLFNRWPDGDGGRGPSQSGSCVLLGSQALRPPRLQWSGSLPASPWAPPVQAHPECAGSGGPPSALLGVGRRGRAASSR